MSTINIVSIFSFLLLVISAIIYIYLHINYKRKVKLVANIVFEIIMETMRKQGISEKQIDKILNSIIEEFKNIKS